MSARVEQDDIFSSRRDGSVFLRLAQVLSPDRRMVAAGLLCVVTASVCDLVIPILLSQTAQAITDSHSKQRFTWLAIFLAIGVALRFTGQFGQTSIFTWFNHRLGLALRGRLFRHLQELGPPFVDQLGVGRVMTRIIGDVGVVNEMFGTGVISLIANVTVLLGIAIVMLVANWRLALVAFALLPFMVAGSSWWRKDAIARFRRNRAANTAVNAFIAQSIDGARVIQAFAQEPIAIQEFDTLNRTLFNTLKRSQKRSVMLGPSLQFISTTTVVAVLIIGGAGLFGTTPSIGELVLFTSLVDRFFLPIIQLGDLVTVAQAGAASAERIVSVLDTPPTVTDAPGAKPMPPIVGHVRFDNVRFGYGSHEVLHGIDLEIKPGQTLALVGETGSGKSTIASLLMRAADPWSGAVTIDGCDLRAVTQRSLRTQYGVALQEPYLFPGSIKDNMRIAAPNVSDAQIEEAMKRVGAHDFVMSLPEGYDTPVQERGSRLSRGQRQLLAFARALLADPRILILDEASSGVDPLTEQLMQAAQRALLSGRTSVVVAHRLATIREADQVIVLQHGDIVERGRHAELLAAGGYYARLVAELHGAGE
jgi:ATP-binding cassette, subfamily B, multidrug efflux pump